MGEQAPSYASTAAVAGLAREVEAVRRTVDRLRALPGRVEEIAGLLARLAENTAGSGAADQAEGPPTLLGLPPGIDPAAVEFALVDLAGWLGAIYLRYADARTLPACWLWHPDVVEELLWLQAAWQAVYTGPRASVTLAGDWHDRQRPGVVRRIKAAAGMCSIENHQPGGAAHIPAAGVPLAGAAATIAAWWASNRDHRPPAPADQHLAEATARWPRGSTRSRA